MDTKLLFYEKQQFRQWWLWVLLLGLNANMLYLLVFKENIAFTAGALLLVLITVWLWRLTLITKINEKGIFVKFKGFHRDFKFYSWEIISSCEIKKYNPIMDYGGWGIRIGAFNVSGNDGLLIRFTNGKTLLIGTNKPNDIFKVLSEIESKNPVL